MIQALGRVVRATFIHEFIERWRYGNLYCDLAKNGNLISLPDEIKRLTILLYARLYHLTTFVETGTYSGDTVDALRNEFRSIYSIELQPAFYAQAKKRFAGLDHIHILNGDSAALLPQILSDIKIPCLFWLDAHYSSGNTARGSKDTPVVEELNHILSNPQDHVILIDDARFFTGHGDYPRLDQVKRMVLQRRPHYFFDVRHDIIRE